MFTDAVYVDLTKKVKDVLKRHDIDYLNEDKEGFKEVKDFKENDFHIKNAPEIAIAQRTELSEKKKVFFHGDPKKHAFYLIEKPAIPKDNNKPFRYRPVTDTYYHGDPDHAWAFWDYGTEPPDENCKTANWADKQWRWSMYDITISLNDYCDKCTEIKMDVAEQLQRTRICFDKTNARWPCYLSQWPPKKKYQCNGHETNPGIKQVNPKFLSVSAWPHDDQTYPAYDGELKCNNAEEVHNSDAAQGTEKKYICKGHLGEFNGEKSPYDPVKLDEMWEYEWTSYNSKNSRDYLMERMDTLNTSIHKEPGNAVNDTPPNEKDLQKRWVDYVKKLLSTHLNHHVFNNEKDLQKRWQNITQKVGEVCEIIAGKQTDLYFHGKPENNWALWYYGQTSPDNKSEENFNGWETDYVTVSIGSFCSRLRELDLTDEEKNQRKREGRGLIWKPIKKYKCLGHKTDPGPKKANNKYQSVKAVHPTEIYQEHGVSFQALTSYLMTFSDPEIPIQPLMVHDLNKTDILDFPKIIKKPTKYNINEGEKFDDNAWIEKKSAVYISDVSEVDVKLKGQQREQTVANYIEEFLKEKNEDDHAYTKSCKAVLTDLTNRRRGWNKYEPGLAIPEEDIERVVPFKFSSNVLYKTVDFDIENCEVEEAEREDFYPGGRNDANERGCIGEGGCWRIAKPGYPWCYKKNKKKMKLSVFNALITYTFDRNKMDKTSPAAIKDPINKMYEVTVFAFGINEDENIKDRVSFKNFVTKVNIFYESTKNQFYSNLPSIFPPPAGSMVGENAEKYQKFIRNMEDILEGKRLNCSKWAPEKWYDPITGEEVDFKYLGTIDYQDPLESAVPPQGVRSRPDLHPTIMNIPYLQKDTPTADDFENGLAVYMVFVTPNNNAGHANLLIWYNGIFYGFGGATDNSTYNNQIIDAYGETHKKDVQGTGEPSYTNFLVQSPDIAQVCPKSFLYENIKITKPFLEKNGIPVGGKLGIDRHNLLAAGILKKEHINRIKDLLLIQKYGNSTQRYDTLTPTRFIRTTENIGVFMNAFEMPFAYNLESAFANSSKRDDIKLNCVTILEVLFFDFRCSRIVEVPMGQGQKPVSVPTTNEGVPQVFIQMAEQLAAAHDMLKQLPKNWKKLIGICPMAISFEKVQKLIKLIGINIRHTVYKEATIKVEYKDSELLNKIGGKVQLPVWGQVSQLPVYGGSMTRRNNMKKKYNGTRKYKVLSPRKTVRRYRRRG